VHARCKSPIATVPSQFAGLGRLATGNRTVSRLPADVVLLYSILDTWLRLITVQRPLKVSGSLPFDQSRSPYFYAMDVRPLKHSPALGPGCAGPTVNLPYEDRAPARPQQAQAQLPLCGGPAFAVDPKDAAPRKHTQYDSYHLIHSIHCHGAPPVSSNRYRLALVGTHTSRARLCSQSHTTAEF
jgi:hypothetical protein